MLIADEVKQEEIVIGLGSAVVNMMDVENWRGKEPSGEQTSEQMDST